ncbi:MAG: hypothetical protein IH571_05210, partial [Acholeplasmataceae bacterium]|nr:hypothetical protein [Acholeplasmataceae bacterium]
QEQIMQIASEFAGYTLAEADLLRRGISKKDKQILQEERIRFVNKCKKMKESEQLAEHIYDYIVKFADYGFNRSHSVAYTMVAYQMAYLKENHFAYFMTVLLSSVIGNESLTKEYINETRKQHIKIVSPHINQSTHVYQYIDGGILLPLLMIRSIGSNTVQKIIDERKNRPFENYQDFKYRLKKDINEKNLEMLIHSGALDVFNLNRKTMSYHKQIEDAGYEQYISDFHLKNMEDFLFSEKAELEKEALGFNLLFSPLQAFEDVRKQENLETFENFKTHQTIEVLAYAKKIKTITTKQGKTMAFITLDDGQLEIEATLFQDAYQKYEQNLSQDIRIYKIRLDEYRKKVAYVIESIRDIKKIKSKDVDHMV